MRLSERVRQVGLDGSMRELLRMRTVQSLKSIRESTKTRKYPDIVVAERVFDYLEVGVTVEIDGPT